MGMIVTVGTTGLEGCEQLAEPPLACPFSSFISGTSLHVTSFSEVVLLYMRHAWRLRARVVCS